MNDAPPTPIGVLTKAIIQASVTSPVSSTVAEKFWGIYRQLVEFHHGPEMDEQKERAATRMLGAECAKLQMTNPGLGAALYSSLRKGLTEGTCEDGDFETGYSSERLRPLGKPGQFR